MTFRSDSEVAGACYGIAVAEIILFIVYIVTQSRRLKEKIISMGRLIPSVPLVVVVPGQVVQQTNIQAVYPAQPTPQYPIQYPPQSQYPVPQQNVQVCPQYPPENIQTYASNPTPPQPGFNPPQDYPPPYTERPQK